MQLSRKWWKTRAEDFPSSMIWRPWYNMLLTCQFPSAWEQDFERSFTQCSQFWSGFSWGLQILVRQIQNELVTCARCTSHETRFNRSHCLVSMCSTQAWHSDAGRVKSHTSCYSYLTSRTEIVKSCSNVITDFFCKIVSCLSWSWMVF